MFLFFLIKSSFYRSKVQSPIVELHNHSTYYSCPVNLIQRTPADGQLVAHPKIKNKTN